MSKSQIYQTGTVNSLLEAVYEGDVAIGHLKQNGDFGIGAFDSIDGEMIIYDGICYRANAYGELNIVDDKAKTPFAMVSKFSPTIRFELQAGNYASIEQQIEKYFPSQNLIYTVLIKGKFTKVDLRSEHCTCRPYKRLVDILPQLQTTFVVNDLEGVMIGMWFPKYMNQLNVPGFHFHFIDNHKQVGGHVFGFDFEHGECQLEIIHGFQMELLATKDFYAADLNKTTSTEIAKVEQIR